MLTAHQVLHGYHSGIFPMADPDEDNTIFWYEPEMRGIIMPQEFHISKNLARLYRKGQFELRINSNFKKCMELCASRDETWISDEIIEVFCELAKMGYGHSFEAWQNGEMVGGLYGIAIGKIFFGESMFHTVKDASKIALVYLVDWMKENEIELLDCQFITEHLLQFGAREIKQSEYLNMLHQLI